MSPDQNYSRYQFSEVFHGVIIKPARLRTMVMGEGKLHEDVKLHSIQRLSQPTDYRCWETTARIAVLWKYGERVLPEYEKRVAPFLARNRGLTRREMANFYVRSLGMTAKPRAEMVAGLSPLIWTHAVEDRGHAMVIFGFDHRDRDNKFFANWDPGATISFDTNQKAKLGGKARWISYRTFARDNGDQMVWGYF